MAPTNQRLQHLKARGIDEFRRFALIFVYLWLVFGLFALNQAVILRDTSYLGQGFAIINAAVFAKIMLVAEDLKVGNRFGTSPLIYPVIYKTFLFSLLFVVFHILEEVLAGLWKGKSIAASFPQFGDGTLAGALCVWGIVFVSLLPFFAIREISRVLGEHELWNLFFRSGTGRAGG